jgi:hypothetical protein
VRRRYRWDETLAKMVEITNEQREFGQLIIGDLPDFVSPIDGEVVHGRRGLREHNKRHDVTHPSDFKETWAKAREQREKYFTEGPRGANARHIARALERKR